MKRLTPIILAMMLTTVVSSTAFAGHITGGRTAGHITTGRAAGHMPTGRTSTVATPEGSINNPEQTSFDLETAIPEGFASLIRMFLESGALL